MDLQDYTDLIYNTEQKTNVNRFTSNGIELWPLYRQHTIGIFRNPKTYYVVKNEKNAQRNILKDLLRYIYYKNIFYKKVVKEIERSVKNETIDVLLYSKSATHSDQIDGKWYDKFVDPFYEILNGNYKLKKVELLSIKEEKKDKRVIDTVFIDSKKFDDYFLHTNKQNKSLDLELITKEVSELTGISFVDKRIDRTFYEIIRYRDFFRLVLKQLNPRFIFLKCYYELDSFGLMLAAKELGIRTIDVQHGKQGVSHPMYTHYSKIPASGYKLLPDYFWNWGEESKVNIEKWHNNKTAHCPVVGGNLWLAKWKFSDFYKYRSEPEAFFVDSLREFERVILYTTQPIEKENILPKHIIEAIHNSPDNWIWLIRVHPFQKLSEKEILNLIGNSKAKIEIKYSTELPLYFIFKKITHHITLWSSTCFEANDFNIPTIIAHPFGAKIYDEFFKSNVFFYSVNASEILELIRSDKKNEKCNYIETSATVAKEAFQRIGLKIDKVYSA